MPRSKKVIADESIQGTNDSSIASKRSVERLYSKTGDVEFFKHFVPKPQRRSPVINRGYWTRMRAMGYHIEQFAASSGKPKVVVNLGCGFDPYAFQYLNEHNDNLAFVDVDYPELMQKKATVIMNTELVDIIGGIEQSKNPNVHLKSKRYYTVSCDLRDLAKFTQILQSLFKLEETSFLFTAEVSMTYMVQECADNLIAWAQSLPDAQFALLEQMMPASEQHPFAKRMLNHFKSYGSPLNCIEAYPKLNDQISRFESRGWVVDEAKDLYKFWKDNVSEEEKQFVENVEQFDEWEEFIVFGQHYFILHASSNENTTSQATQELLSQQSQPTIPVTSVPAQLQVKLASGVLYQDKLVSFGGMTATSRQSDLVDAATTATIASSPLTPRMCHTMTRLANGKLIVVGGREGPRKLLSDCWVYDGEWRQVQSLPYPRYRHCAVALPESQLLVFGGNTDGASWMLWSEEKGWVELSCNIDLGSRFSAALSWGGDCYGVLVGGMSEYSIHQDMWKVCLEGSQVQLDLQCEHSLLQRYSAQIVLLNDDDVMVIGGVSEQELFNKHTTFIKVNLSSRSIQPLTLDIDMQPLWASFSACRDGNTVYTFGGGAACYGFGSHWDCIHKIEL